MPHQSNEANIILAIEAVHKDPKLSIQHAACIYRVPCITISNQIHGQTSLIETHYRRLKMTLAKEKTLIQYIIDLDLQGFLP